MAKDRIINFKVEEEVKVRFEELCTDNFSNPSAELYKFVRNYIRQNEGQRILLKDIKHKV